MCLHLNNMRLDEIDALGRFVVANANRIIGFEEAYTHAVPSLLMWPGGLMLRLALTAKWYMQ